MLLNIRKYGILITGLFLGILIMAGCGSASGGDGFDPDRIVYLAEYPAVDMENVDDRLMLEQEGSLYMIQSEYDEAAQEMSYQLIRQGLTDGSYQETSLTGMQEGNNIQSVTWTAEGNLMLLSMIYQEDKQFYYLYQFSREGEKLGESDISDSIARYKAQYIQNLAGDRQGNLILNMQTEEGNSVLLVTDESGTVKGTIEYTDYVEQIFADREGNLYISGWGSSGGRGVYQIDMTGLKVGEELSLQGVSDYGSLMFAPGRTSGLILGTGSGIYEYDAESGQFTQVLDWLDSDVNSNNIRSIGTMGENGYWAFIQTYGEEGSQGELCLLSKTTAGELPRKETITYGTLSVGYEMRSAIIEFNKTNPDYRIEVKEYLNQAELDSLASSGDMDAYMTGYYESITRMNTEIAGGGGPDLIGLSDINHEQMIQIGILEDLAPWFDQDERLKREDYLANIFSAYEVGGKQYGLLDSFAVGALVGSTEKLEGIDRWDLTGMIEFAGEYPDSKLLNQTASGILNTLLAADMGRFMDWETGTCTFDSEEFISLLEYANTYGTESDDWMSPDRMGTHESIQSGQYLLLDQFITSWESIQMMEAMFDGPVSFIGYPSGEGSGIVMIPFNSIAMNAESGQKEGAWEFLVFLLSDTYQDSLKEQMRGGRIPIRISDLDEMCLTAMEEETNAGSTWGYDDLEVEIRPATQAQIDQFRALIDSAQTLYDLDTQVLSMIEEETSAYFGDGSQNNPGAENGTVGQRKTAAEVAEILQSRIQLFMNESR